MISSTEVPMYGAELSVGALIGPWIVEELRHRGPVATLYRARNAQSGKLAAVKVLHQQLVASKKILQRFQREADALKKLRHPNIVEIWETGELKDGRPYLVMEWLDGRDLAAELSQRGPYTAHEVLTLTEQIGAGLGAAHRSGIVHRDLKAQNVMVISRGEQLTLKVVDFGIARLLAPDAGEQGLTSTGMILGTPASMAPEQIRGEVADIRTDVYGLGILLYQLVTGQLPFRGATPIETEEMHLHAPAPRPSDVAPVPPSFDRIVARCLEKHREHRFESVEAVLTELRQALVANTRRSARQEANAFGAYVEVTIDPEIEDPGEPVYRETDAVLETIRDAFCEWGLQLAVQTGNALVAAAVLPSSEDEALSARRRWLQSAIELESKLFSRPSAVCASITLTASRGAFQIYGNGDCSWVGGEILSVARWVGPPAGGVYATKEAVAGLEHAFSLNPLPGWEHLSVVKARREQITA